MQAASEDGTAQATETYDDDITAAPYLVPQPASGTSHVELLGERSDSDSQVRYNDNEEADEEEAPVADAGSGYDLSGDDNEEMSDAEADAVGDTTSLPEGEDEGSDVEGGDEDEEGTSTTQPGSAAVTSHDEAAASPNGDAQDDFTTAFAFSRVKELLKLESECGVVSREATLATCEALALMLRDLTSTAAAEATRQGRKTVTYDDLARVVQLYDRFAYLADVLPPRMLASGIGAGKPRTTHTTSGVATTSSSSITRATQSAPFGLRSQRTTTNNSNTTSAMTLRKHKAGASGDTVKAKAKANTEIMAEQSALRQTTLSFGPS